MNGSEIIYIDDFGAKGDGVTDDSQAIAATIEKAVSVGSNVEVVFSCDRTYRISKYSYSFDFPMPAGIVLKNASNISLRGKNTTLLLSVPLKALCVMDCDHISVSGFNFDYSPKFAIGAEVIDHNYSSLEFTVKTTEPLEFEGNVFEASAVVPDFFGLPESDNTKYYREHMYIERYYRTADPLVYRVAFRRDDRISDRMRLTVENKYSFILPIPGVAHSLGEAYYIGFSKNVHLIDCEIWAAPHFVFALKGNTGELWFNHVNIRPNPNSNVPIAGWRDGFHCKDNRGAIHWDNCIVEKIHDDTFNISCTLLYITEVLSDTEFVAACTEMGGCYYPVFEGDEVTVFNPETGKLSGNVHIKKVVAQKGPANHFIVDTPCDFSVGDKVAFDSMAAPGSTIDNCRIDGTVRYRGRLTVRNSDYRLLIMWIQNETLFEGPIPKNILFENCRIEGYHSDNKMITILTEMNGGGMPDYKCRNIVFRNCLMNRNQVGVQQGNEVSFEWRENPQ